MKNVELLDFALKGVCAVSRLNTVLNTVFLISPQEDMLWLLFRIASLRQF